MGRQRGEPCTDPPWHVYFRDEERRPAVVTVPRTRYLLTVSGICPSPPTFAHPSLPNVRSYHLCTRPDCFCLRSGLLQPGLRPPTSVSFQNANQSMSPKPLDGFPLPSRQSPSLCSLAHGPFTTCCGHTHPSSPQAPSAPATAKGSRFPESIPSLFTCLLGRLPHPSSRLLLLEAPQEAPD